MTGTLIAQIISFAALPVVARIYSPSDFSILAAYVSVTAIFFTVAALRYDLAIPVPVENGDADCLLKISVYLSTITSIAVLVLVLLIDRFFRDFEYSFYNEDVANVLLWLPIGMFICSQNFIFKQWQARIKNFKLIAKAQIFQVVVGFFLQILLFYVGFEVAGLIIGYVVSVAGSAPFLYLKSNQSLRIKNKTKDIFLTLKKYKNYPKYSTWEALFNVGGIELPVFMISIFLLGPESGYLFVVMRLFGAPVSLLGGAIGQVYLANAGTEFKNNRLGYFTKKIILSVLKISIFPLLLLAFFAPSLFELLLGEGWGRAGEIAVWAMPWFLFQLLVSPVSTVFHVCNSQRLALKIQIFGFLLRNASVMIAIFLFEEHVSAIYAISGAVFYAVYLYYSIKVCFSKKSLIVTVD